MSATHEPPGTIWITGLSASGKSTLSETVGRALGEHGYPCIVVDGEMVRERMGNVLGHTLEDRFVMLKNIVSVALEERSKGFVPIVATISHKREMRAFARQALGGMMEVYLDCAASVCAARDRKGHYRRALAGAYACFVGVTEPYETWDEADLVIDTARSSVAEATETLLRATLEFLGEPQPPTPLRVMAGRPSRPRAPSPSSSL